MGRIVLITGSRAATPAMLTCAKQVVQWIAAKGYTCIVGDAPGVDAEVRVACEALQLKPYVWGAKGIIRQPWINSEREIRHTSWRGYLQRDREMAFRSEWCIAIWDGTSRGTKFTADYAASLGRKVIWRVFEP